jgi:hypothetical protein
VCQQEWIRQTVYTTPDGWDWDDDEYPLLPMPIPVGDKLVVKGQIEPTSILFPVTATLGLGFLDLSLHLPVLVLILQALFVLHLTVKGEDYLQEIRTLFGLESEL